MGYLKEKVAYLRGMAEGMQLSESTNEGKLLKAILEVMDDIALSVEDVEEVQEQLSEQVDSIDEDLAEIERIVLDEDEYDEDDDDVYYKEIKCPHCNEEIEVDVDAIEEDGTTIECPNCHNDIEIDWECTCGCCDEEEEEDKE